MIEPMRSGDDHGNGDPFLERTDAVVATPTAMAIGYLAHVRHGGLYTARIGFRHENGGAGTAGDVDCCDLLLTTRGSGLLAVSGEERAMRPGDVLWVRADQPYVITCADESWAFCFVRICGQVVFGLHEAYVRNGSPVTHACQNASTVLNLLKTLIKLAKVPREQNEIVANDALTHVLTLLLEGRAPNQMDLDSAPDFVSRAAAILNARFQEGVTLGELAEEVGTSKDNLSRSFKSHTGTTVHGYLLANRMRLAKELLAHTNRPVSDIARACGMPHPSHFSSTFKREVGISPLAYRRRWLASHQ